MFSHSFSSNDISNIDHNHTSTSRPVSTAGLDSTLLNATRMSKQLKQIKQLLSKTRAGIRRENPSLTTSRELVGFCEEFAQEFLRCLSVLEPFLEVTRDIFEVVHSILKEYESSSSVNDDCKTQLSDIATEISDTDPKSMSITRLLKQASKSTSDANDKIRAITPEISAVFDLKANKLDGDTILELTNECRDNAKILARRASGMDTLRADCQHVREEAKERLDNYPWRKYSDAQDKIREAEKKIRSLESATDRAAEKRDYALTVKQRLEIANSALRRAPRNEREQFYQSAEKELRKGQQILCDIENEEKKIAANLDMVKEATDRLEEFNPTTHWEVIRVPVRLNTTLLCLLKGPPQIIKRVKVSCLKKNFLAEKFLEPGEQLMSNVIELTNVQIYDPQWPLVVCIPQKRKITNQQLTSVKCSTDTKASSSWSCMRPMEVNIKSGSYPKMNVREFYFAEVKMTSFCTLAIIEKTKVTPLATASFEHNCTRSSESTTKQIPKQFLFPDDKFIFQLVSHFNEDWRRILVDIGVDYNVIKNYELDSKNRLETMTNCMLTWRQTVHSDWERYRQMTKAFELSKREDLVHKVIEIWSDLNLSEGQIESSDEN